MRKFILSEDVDIVALATSIPCQCTGADLYGLCADAWMHALRRQIRDLTTAGTLQGDTDEAQDFDDVDIVVTNDDLRAARSNMVPSLTLQDLDRYDALEAKYTVGKETAVQATGERAARRDSAKLGGLAALPKRKKQSVNDAGTDSLMPAAEADGSAAGAGGTLLGQQDEAVGDPLNVMG
jgi:hypothetical protein